MATEETVLFTHRGFQVILPANMVEQLPYVWLSRKGKYYVELGNTEVGGLIRIDNFLDSMSTHLAKLEESLEQLENRQKLIQAELDKNENYTDLIEKYTKKLEQIDKKLGVNDK